MPPQQNNKAALVIVAMMNKLMTKGFDKISQSIEVLAGELRRDKEAYKAMVTLLGNLKSLEGLRGLQDLGKLQTSLAEAVTELERIAEDRPSTELRESNRILKQFTESFTMPEFDTTKVEAGLNKLNDKVDKLVAKDDPAIKNLLADLNNAIGKIKMPDRVKLDDMDLRTIRSSGGGVALASAPGMLATNARVANVSLSAGTEGSYAFPLGTVGFYIKARAQNILIQYAWTSGQSNTTFLTVPQNGMMSRPGMDFTSKTIYLYAASAATVEIEVYQA